MHIPEKPVKPVKSLRRQQQALITKRVTASLGYLTTRHRTVKPVKNGLPLMALTYLTGLTILISRASGSHRTYLYINKEEKRKNLNELTALTGFRRVGKEREEIMSKITPLLSHRSMKSLDVPGGGSEAIQNAPLRPPLRTTQPLIAAIGVGMDTWRPHNAAEAAGALAGAPGDRTLHTEPHSSIKEKQK